MPIIVFSENRLYKPSGQSAVNMCKNVRGLPLSFVRAGFCMAVRQKKRPERGPYRYSTIGPIEFNAGFCDNLQKIEPVERENRQRSQNVIVPIVVKFLLKLTFFFWDFYVFVPKDESPSSNGRVLCDLLLPNRSFLTFFLNWDTL